MGELRKWIKLFCQFVRRTCEGTHWALLLRIFVSNKRLSRRRQNLWRLRIWTSRKFFLFIALLSRHFSHWALLPVNSAGCTCKRLEPIRLSAIRSYILRPLQLTRGQRLGFFFYRSVLLLLFMCCVLGILIPDWLILHNKRTQYLLKNQLKNHIPKGLQSQRCSLSQ